MNQKRCQAIFERFQKANPHPTTELKYSSPFELLISVILSAQATDVSVNKATQHLYPTHDTPKKMCQLGVEGLEKYIKSIGLYHTKARNIIKTCHILIHDYQSQIPNTRQALESLPGVGRKTANVILNTVFGQPTMAVDTHILRMSRRVGLSLGKTPLEVEKDLIQVIPKAFALHAHHWLILHGRYVCTAKKPRCKQCIIHDLCEYMNKTPQ